MQIYKVKPLESLLGAFCTLFHTNINYRNLGISFADGRINTSSASYNAGYEAATPTVVNCGYYSVKGNSSTVQVTVNLSGYNGYQNFELYKNIFPVFVSIGHYGESSDDSNHAATVSCSYDKTTGVFSIFISRESSKWYTRGEFNLYLVY